MSVNIDLYEDYGPASNGRGTSTSKILDWNLKSSDDHSSVYYPTNAPGINSAPLSNSYSPGELVWSYKRYLFFKIEGTYSKLKNFKLTFSLASANQAYANLYVKMTNVYAPPSNSFNDPGILVASNSTIVVSQLIPNLSSVGPNLATSRSNAYTGNQTLFTNYIVVQMAVPANSPIGNTPSYKIKLTANNHWSL